MKTIWRTVGSGPFLPPNHLRSEDASRLRCILNDQELTAGILAL
jgi:hypothetical protein